MTQLFRTLGLFSLPFMLSGCFGEDDPDHSIQYFLDHPEERARMINECEVMDNALSEANCRNAIYAEQSIASQKRRDQEKSDVNSLYGTGS